MAVSRLVALPALLLLAACDLDGAPKMTITGPNPLPCDFGNGVDYGEDVELYCSFSDTNNLVIRRRTSTNSENLPTTVLNTTTVSSTLKPTLGMYIDFCTDSKSGCQECLSVHHRPAMHVSSPRVQFQRKLFSVGTDSGELSYFVPRGEDFQVSCAGKEYQTLRIYGQTNKTGSQVAFVSWSTYYWYDGGEVYRVLQYRLVYGEKWQEADMSSLQCDLFFCHLRLSVPYPESAYEARVSGRNKAATDDGLWSDPASISFATTPREDCACTPAQHELTDGITPVDASCEACKLIDHVLKANTALSKLKSSMKQKLDQTVL